MSVQLETLGVSHGFFSDESQPTNQLDSTLAAPDAAANKLCEVDLNLPSPSTSIPSDKSCHHASGPAPSNLAAQKALNQLASRPSAFASPVGRVPQSDQPSFDLDQLLQEEEEMFAAQEDREHLNGDVEQQRGGRDESSGNQEGGVKLRDRREDGRGDVDELAGSTEDEHRDFHRAEAAARKEQQEGQPRPCRLELGMQPEDALGMSQPLLGSTSTMAVGDTLVSTASMQAPSVLAANLATPAEDSSLPRSRPSISAMELAQAEIDKEARELASRPQARDLAKPSKQFDPPSTSLVPAQDAAIPKYIPAGFAYATSFDGKELRFERRKRLRGWKPTEAYAETRVENLLSTPIYLLREKVEALKAVQIVEQDEAKELAAAAAAPRDGNRRRAKSSDRIDQMWVDRYRPKKFTELLGDERLHREVLGWLKEWDECVFKRKNLRKQRHQEYLQAKYASGSGSGEAPSKQSGGALGSDARQYGSVPAFGESKPVWKDPWGRPNERILMVSGPPGLGKTTLAHVIAKQAGYNVFELNASDARNAGAVDDLIRTALESGSLKDPRPTLVVIDEIDGASGSAGGSSGGDGGAGSTGGEGAGFVRALVRLIENGKGSSHGKAGGRGSGGLSARGKKKKGHKPLLRPIICICNDLYAPALRPLRPLAKLIRFNKAPTNLIVRRLREICDVESVEADVPGLSLLSELTGGDIRACINALEFAKTKNLYLSEAAVRNAAVGIKDTGTTVHRVWEMLFRTQNRKEKIQSSTRGQQAGLVESAGNVPWNLPAPKRSGSHDHPGGSGGARARRSNRADDIVLVDTPHENVNRLIHEITSCNEYDKLAQGCFEHYPHLRPSDDGWTRFQKAHEWLYFGQALSQRAWSGGNYELLAFLPWSFVPWHLLFANVGNRLPEYPRVDYENYIKTTAYLEIAETLHTSLSPSLRIHFNRHSLLLELGPTLLRILTPELRPINNTIVAPAERATLSRLVSIMLDLNVSLVQDRVEGDSTSLVWKLDPPLEVFNLYEGKTSKDVGKTRLAVRAIVAREMDKERTRRKNGGTVGEDGAVEPGLAAESTATKAMSVYRRAGGAASSHTDGPGKANKVAKDFFGRIIQPRLSTGAATVVANEVEIPEGMGQRKRAADVGIVAETAKKAKTGEQRGGVKVFYRYHEGFSNAVRRPVKMSSLL